MLKIIFRCECEWIDRARKMYTATMTASKRLAQDPSVNGKGTYGVPGLDHKLLKIGGFWGNKRQFYLELQPMRSYSSSSRSWTNAWTDSTEGTLQAYKLRPQEVVWGKWWGEEKQREDWIKCGQLRCMHVWNFYPIKRNIKTTEKLSCQCK